MNEQQAREILELPSYANRKQGYNRYRYLLKIHHPDKGGSTEMCQILIAAWDVLKDVLSHDLRIATLQEVDRNGERKFIRLATRVPDNGETDNFSFDYERIKSNVYEWRCIPDNEQFYPRFPEEDKTLIDGKNCKVILFHKAESSCDWAEWAVPWK